MTSPTPTPPADEPGQVAELNETVVGLRQDVRDLRDTQAENTVELRTKQAKSDLALAETRRQGKRTRRQGIALIVLVVLLVGLKWRDDRQKEEDLKAAAVVTCRNANESRRSIIDLVEKVIVISASRNAPTDPVAKAAQEHAVSDFIGRIEAEIPQALKPRDCSEKAATQPTLVPTTAAG